KRKSHTNPDATGIAGDIAGASHIQSMFANRLETDAAALRTFILKTAAVVFQAEFDHLVVRRERQLQTGSAGMPRHIGNTLLGATIDRDLYCMGRLHRKLPDIGFEFKTTCQAARLDQKANRLFSRKSLPFRRMEIM